MEKRSGKLYWSDREGMRVMRANLDGSQIETLVDTSVGDSRPGSDQRKWCVGIAVDTDGGKFYWTQKGGHHAGLGRIFRANIQVSQGQSAENRRDIEPLYDNLPEPIDLDLDPVNRTLYWTDRGDPPRGNTVSRAPMDPQSENGKEPEILTRSYGRDLRTPRSPTVPLRLTRFAPNRGPQVQCRLVLSTALSSRKAGLHRWAMG
jgi:hypothetical protein